MFCAQNKENNCVLIAFETKQCSVVLLSSFFLRIIAVHSTPCLCLLSPYPPVIVGLGIVTQPLEETLPVSEGREVSRCRLLREGLSRDDLGDDVTGDSHHCGAAIVELRVLLADLRVRGGA